tara:strand:+ start:4214 stop:4870 length:657 start_codon:yes stop_codon:yes gene_type:complete
MKTLREISEKNNSNKLQHGYELFYEEKLGYLRQEPIKLLEIGIWKGDSLRMWRDYFKKGQVYGIDIVPESVKSAKGSRITAEVVDQNDREQLIAFAKKHGPFDIIVDDGSHVMEHMQTSFGCLFPYLKSGGHYMIEDIQTSYDYQDRIPTRQLLDSYGVSRDFYNTTYVMVKNAVEFGEYKSQYITDAELKYINKNVKSTELDVRNDFFSVTSNIVKK